MMRRAQVSRAHIAPESPFPFQAQLWKVAGMSAGNWAKLLALMSATFFLFMFSHFLLARIDTFYLYELRGWSRSIYNKSIDWLRATVFALRPLFLKLNLLFSYRHIFYIEHTPHPLSDSSSPLPFVPFVPENNFTSAIILYTHTTYTYMVVCDYVKSRTPQNERTYLSLWDWLNLLNMII